MKSAKYLVILALIAATLWLLSDREAPIATANGNQPSVVRIAMNAGAAGGQSRSGHSNYPTARVIEEGWLAQQLQDRGIELRWVPITGELGPITNEAFASGRIDFANIGDLPSIILNARSTRTRLLAPNGKGTDVFLTVPVQSQARSLDDLKGKRVSVQLSRPWELGFRELAHENGLEFSDFRNFNLTPQVSTNALALGNIDAVFGTNGYLFEEKGIGRTLWSSRGKPYYKVRSSELWGTADFIGRYPEITQLVVTAYVRAQHWVAQEASREAAVRQAVLNGYSEYIARRIHDDAVPWRDHWSPLFDGLVTGHYRRALAFAADTRLVPKPIPLAEIIDDRFVEAALRELGLQDFWTAWPEQEPPPASHSLARSRSPSR